MKNREKIILAITSAAALGFMIYFTQRKKTLRMLDQIADEGYETAGDILFPLRGRKERRSRRNYNSLNRWENGLFY